MRGGLGALSAWGRTVAASALVVGLGAVAVAVAWAASRESRVATSIVRGEPEGVVLDAGDGSVEIVGGGDEATEIVVRRRDRAAFGHQPDVRRELRDGVLHLRGRCPSGVLTSCGSDWRLVVPDNVPVTVRTDGGDVALRSFRGSAEVRTRSGDVRIGPFCGFSLAARTETGLLEASVTCPLEHLSLRSRAGDVHATVPTGRYRVDADSDSGTSSVRGITAADDAPFHVQALSDSGDVAVEGRR